MRDITKFKIGFCRGLANMGLTPSDIERAIEKRAAFGVGDAAWNTAKSLLWLSIAVPSIIGAGTGGIGYAMSSADSPTLEDVQAMDTESAYTTAAKRIRQRIEERKMRSGGPISPKKPASQPGLASDEFAELERA